MIDFEQCRLTRDRAAARLRRMRKKATMDFNELRVKNMKACIDTLHVGPCK